MFKKNQYVVYPGHGVGLVERYEKKAVLGRVTNYCVIKINTSGMKIMFPAGSAETLGIRPIATAKQAREVLRILNAKPKSNSGNTWNKRYREYMETIKTGDMMQIAEVLAAIVQLRVDKELSFGERKMLDNCRALLSEEIRLALGLSDQETASLFAVAG